MREVERTIIRVILFCSSIFCFYGAYLNLCIPSTNNYINAIRGDVQLMRNIIAFLVVMLGSFLLYLARSIYGNPRKTSILTIGLVIFIAIFAYEQYVENNLIVIDVKEFVNAPVVQGYDREGYIAEFPSLNNSKVEAYLASIESPEDRARIEYIFDTSGFSTSIYEDFQNFESRRDGAIHNGDEIHVQFTFNETFAQKYHISFDNIFISFDVESLEEKPVINWAISTDQLMRIALNYERSVGSDANMAEIEAEYDNGDVEVRTYHIDEEQRISIRYLRINRETLIGEDRITGFFIDFNEFY